MKLPDTLFAKMWDTMDWDAAEAKLADYQARLTRAAYRGDGEEIERLQKLLVRDDEMKCLAVRHVAQTATAPGVDGVKWRTSADKMKAVISLTSKDYHASPLRQIIITDKRGKERRPAIPTFYDRAMNVLYSYSFIPVAEAHADRKSFAFRKGRSTQDAHAYVFEALKGQNAPRYVVYADIRACYAHIQHAWVLQNVPMDKAVLAEFLRAGIVFAGELYPAEDQGISLGASLSPYIANYVLDGLQQRIFDEMYRHRPCDYADGNLIRFCDDMVITARSEDSAKWILEIIADFLKERGLYLSREKTKIYRIEDGFTFLSRTYIRKNGVIYSYPSDAAVERFIGELRDHILSFRKSQRELINGLNSRLRGWANYHRYCDAEAAFRRVDAAVQTTLWEAEIRRHPKLQQAKLKEKYWYKEPDGRHCYALPDDKSVRVLRLADTVLITQNKVKTNANAFLDTDYTEKRTHERDIQHVTGAYREVWERQGGRCYYCGRPILSDQPRAVTALDLQRPPSVRNSAYIHRMCALNELEIIRTDEDISCLRPFDMIGILESIAEKGAPTVADKDWKYHKLAEFFAEATDAAITLTFHRIEEISGGPLPPSARKYPSWWYPHVGCRKIADAWINAGYRMKKLDIPTERAVFCRAVSGVSRVNIPDAILNGKLPDDAVFELETHMAYIMKKYGIQSN